MRKGLRPVAALMISSAALHACGGIDEQETAPIRVHPTVDAMDLAMATPGAASTPGAPPLLLWRGGVGGQGVETQPKVYLVLWGSQWTGADPSNEANILKAFYGGLSGSKWLAALTQYCQQAKANAAGCAGVAAASLVNGKSDFGGVWADSAKPAPKNPTQAQFAAEAVAAAKYFGNLTAASNGNAQYVIATPHGNNSVGFGTQYCAWHSATSSSYGSLAFTNLPYMTDAGAACGANFVNGGKAGLTDGITIVAGHELAETVTDNWVGSGWIDAQGGEIGDKCAWIRSGQGAAVNLALGTGTFAVQSLWSNAFNKGAGGCVVSYP